MRPVQGEALAAPMFPVPMQQQLRPNIVDRVDGEGVTVFYMCYSSATKRVIERITITTTETGETTAFDHAFGEWADRATLTYIPHNDQLMQ